MDVQQRVFLRADDHFNHENILVYEKEARPFVSIDEMHQALIKGWNDAVGKDDYVLHLGDFGFGSFDEISRLLSLLHGTKALLRGNHDLSRGAGSWVRAGFVRVHKLEIWFGNCVFSHYPISSLQPGITNYHGHMHSKIMPAYPAPQYRNVSVERCGFGVVELVFSSEAEKNAFLKEVFSTT